jgi:hypothetical protein
LSGNGWRKSKYKDHGFSAEIISHAIWLYHRFTLSFRDVEDLQNLIGLHLWIVGNLIFANFVFARVFARGNPTKPKIGEELTN